MRLPEDVAYLVAHEIKRNALSDRAERNLQIHDTMHKIVNCHLKMETIRIYQGLINGVQ